MKQALAITVFLFVIFAFVPALSYAQDSDISPAWLKGAWSGTSPSPNGSSFQDTREYIFAEDGTFMGTIYSIRGGILDISGSYKIEEDKLTLKGKHKSGILYGSKFEVNLVRNGEELSGSSYNYFTDLRIPFSLQRGAIK